MQLKVESDKEHFRHLLLWLKKKTAAKADLF